MNYSSELLKCSVQKLLLREEKCLEEVNGILAGFIFCRSRFTLPQYRRLKSSYSINKMPNFEEEVEKKEEIEVPGKYMFRPRLPVLIENDRFNVPFQEEYERICREDYAWELELQTLKTVWLEPLFFVFSYKLEATWWRSGGIFPCLWVVCPWYDA